MPVDSICRRGTPRGAARLKLCCSKGFWQNRPVGMRRQRIPVRRYVARHPHVAKRLPRSRGRISRLPDFRYFNAGAASAGATSCDRAGRLDGMGPRRWLRKAVRAVVRAQRGPGDQREKQGERTNDGRGVFSPPSLCTTATRPSCRKLQNQTWAAAVHGLWNCCTFSGRHSVQRLSRCRFRSCGGAEPDVQLRSNRLPRSPPRGVCDYQLHRLLNGERLPRLAIHALLHETFSPRV